MEDRIPSQVQKVPLGTFSVLSKKGKIMADNRDLVIYKFNRGDKYSCKVSIRNSDNLWFDEIIFPKDTPSEVVAKMLEDAEKYALEAFDKENWTT